MSVLVKLTTPSSNWHEGAMTVEVEAQNVNQAFELKERWAELCTGLDKQPDSRSSGKRYAGTGGPTRKQWSFLIDLATQAGASSDEATSFVYKTATEAGVSSLKTANQGEIDTVITALKKKGTKSSDNAPLFDESETKELIEDDPFN